MSTNEKDKAKFGVQDHSGSAGFLQGYREESTTFGGESGRLARHSTFRRYEGAGAEGKVILGTDKAAGVFSGRGSALGLEIKTNTDYISNTLPKYSGSAQLYSAKVVGEVSSKVNGNTHKLGSLTFTGPNAKTSFSIGGKQIVPNAKAGASMGSVEAEAGIDDHKLFSASIDLGQGVSSSFDSLKINPFAMDDYQPFKAKADDSHIGDSFSASVPGIVKSDFKKTGGYKPELGTDISTGNLASRGDDVEALLNHNMISEAKNQHRQNDNVLTKPNSLFAKRNLDRVADKSEALNNRLTEQIDNDKLQKQALNKQLEDPKLTDKEKANLLNKRDKLDDRINKMSDCRQQLVSDRDRANDYRNRDNNRDFNRNGPQRTEDLVSGAKAYSQNFDDKLSSMQESGKLPKDYADQLSTSAKGIHRAQNDLKHRSNQYDRRLNYFNDKIDQVGKDRGAYLDSKGMTPQEAIASKDPQYADFNTYEKNLRDKTADIRQQQGECKKALLETDKLRGSKSEGLRANVRQLESDKIDNANAKAAKDDEIANYCNSHGIPNDSYEDYLNNNDDRGLQKLVDERKELEGKGNDIQRDLDINKGEVAKANESGIKVTDDKGMPNIKRVEDGAVARVKDNEDIRKGEAAKEEEAKLAENNAEQSAAGNDVDGVNNNDSALEAPDASQANEMQSNEVAPAVNKVAENANAQGESQTGLGETGELDKANSDIESRENEGNEIAQNDETADKGALAEGEGSDSVNEIPSESEEGEAVHNEEPEIKDAVEETEPKEETPSEDEDKEASQTEDSQTDSEGEDFKSDDESNIDGEDETSTLEEKTNDESEYAGDSTEEAHSDLEGEENAPEEETQREETSEETGPEEESQDEGEGEDTAYVEESTGGDDAGDDTPEELKDEKENQENESEENQAQDNQTLPEEEAPVTSEGVETSPEEQSNIEAEDKGSEEESRNEESQAAAEEAGPESSEDETYDQSQDNNIEQPEEQAPEEDQSYEEGVASEGQDNDELAATNADEIATTNADEVGNEPEEDSGGITTTSAEEPSYEPQEEQGGMATTSFGGDYGSSYGSSQGMSITNASESPSESESASEGIGTTASGETESAPEVSSGESMDSGRSM